MSQTLLTAIFGENAVRDLARQARRDLVARVERLLAADATRFRERTAGGPTGADAARLRALGTALGEAAS